MGAWGEGRFPGYRDMDGDLEEGEDESVRLLGRGNGRH